MTKFEKYKKQIRIVDNTPFQRKLGFGRCTAMSLDDADQFCMALSLEIKKLRRRDEEHKDALAAVARQNQVARSS